MRKKFTLLELLIVVAIIGILVSILLPSLHKARRTTKIAVCLSNSSQISKALIMYVNDNNHFTPSTRFNGHTTNSRKPAHGWVGEKTALNPGKYRSLNIYLGVNGGRSDVSLPVANCSLDSYPLGRTGYDSYFEAVGSNYIGNARSRDSSALNDNTHGVSILTVKDSSRMVSLVEVGGWHLANGFRGDVWTFSWHQKSQYTLGFLDGHVINTKLYRGLKVTEKYTFDKNQ